MREGECSACKAGRSFSVRKSCYVGKAGVCKTLLLTRKAEGSNKRIRDGVEEAEKKYFGMNKV